MPASPLTDEEIRAYNREVAEDIRRLHDWQMKVILWERRAFRELKPHFCDICRTKGKCRRIPVNRMITQIVLAGGVCPDIDSYWKEIL